MIEKFKGLLFLFRHYKNQKKIESDLYNAKKHALLALAYWKDCQHLTEDCDLHFQMENSSIYVRLGKEVSNLATSPIPTYVKTLFGKQ